MRADPEASWQWRLRRFAPIKSSSGLRSRPEKVAGRRKRCPGKRPRKKAVRSRTRVPESVRSFRGPQVLIRNVKVNVPWHGNQLRIFRIVCLRAKNLDGLGIIFLTKCSGSPSNSPRYWRTFGDGREARLVPAPENWPRKFLPVEQGTFKKGSRQASRGGTWIRSATGPAGRG